MRVKYQKFIIGLGCLMFYRATSVERALVRELRKLPLWQRIFHPKTKKHIVSLMLGVALMASGSAISLNHDIIPTPQICCDVVGYLIHGVGCVPFIHHIEPLWNVFFAVSK